MKHIYGINLLIILISQREDFHHKTADRDAVVTMKKQPSSIPTNTRTTLLTFQSKRFSFDSTSSYPAHQII